jgi:protein-disulfide isomerase
MSKRTGQKQATRMVRDQLAREKRRQRTLWTSVIAVAVLVIAGLLGWAALAGQDGGDYTAPPGAAAGDDSGIAEGDGPVRLDIYADFICPSCKAYEEATASTVDQLLADNRVTVVFHPVAFLDRNSSTRYSTRAASAAGCAAEDGKFPEFAAALFENQPAEGGAGLSDDDLIRVGGEVGLVDPDFAECVRDGEYRPWVAHVTEVASDRGVTGTPTVYVNGKEVERTVEALTAAVEADTP